MLRFMLQFPMIRQRELTTPLPQIAVLRMPTTRDSLPRRFKDVTINRYHPLGYTACLVNKSVAGLQQRATVFRSREAAAEQ